ncbi:peptide-methionine (S)-S-oxide reductase MsrA [Planctomycetes bacterium K23_9]|uniref:Peptide methionine sulfoxide reductase MsrA n=1 Tax=Stieleria marina TaxID=1930275 RepID=A0A517NMS6_9BACT|nr:Peptide methionine sulfoxide reductase MsrA [Planctomycetes bacterium K23_9]
MNQVLTIALLSLFAIGCGGQTTAVTTTQVNSPQSQDTTPQDSNVTLEKATFGAGCFWCVEAVFKMLDGVESVASGYMGGEVDYPTYEQVCKGTTGHAEVIEIQYDPSKITFAELLEVFWKTHDPTTLNQQGNDRGTQYRSAVFYHNAEQKELAETYKKKLNEEKAFANPIVTEITEASKMYVAEDYHQDYFNLNKSNPYCNAVIPPKLEKLKKVFGDKLKK